MLQYHIQWLAGFAILCFTCAITGVRGMWQGCLPRSVQRIYFANHSSHADFVLLWSALPPALRAVTRPVAGSDYWLASPLRRFVGRDVFQAVLIDREFRKNASPNPVEVMQAALDFGDSPIAPAVYFHVIRHWWVL